MNTEGDASVVRDEQRAESLALAADFHRRVMGFRRQVGQKKRMMRAAYYTREIRSVPMSASWGRPHDQSTFRCHKDVQRTRQSDQELAGSPCHLRRIRR
jgi:hypothetical protein